nr:bidirectional sugar transporter N3-like [Ipomoea batatas]
MGFDSLPYTLALLSCKLWMNYGFIKENVTLLIFISSIGVVAETTIPIFSFFLSLQQIKLGYNLTLLRCIHSASRLGYGVLSTAVLANHAVFTSIEQIYFMKQNHPRNACEIVEEAKEIAVNELETLEYPSQEF